MSCSSRLVANCLVHAPLKTSLQTMGRREPYAQDSAAPARDGASRGIPLREHNLGAVTETVQSPSDRFHRWLSNFADMITEYRIGECIIWNTDLDELLEDPLNAVLASAVRKPSTVNEVLYGLNLVKAAFLNLPLRDQLDAARTFEVQTITQLAPNEQNVMTPASVEVLERSFRSTFLETVFNVLWSQIKSQDLEALAIYEVKQVTVFKIPVRWIREDRATLTFAVTSLPQNQRDKCEVCGTPAWLPFDSCFYCNERPCYHHGRCCPNRSQASGSSSSRRGPA